MPRPDHRWNPSAKGKAERLHHQLINLAQNAYTSMRSAQFLLGVNAAITARADGLWVAPRVCPFGMATVERDAFMAGVDEGYALWRAHTEAAAPMATAAPAASSVSDALVAASCGADMGCNS